MTDYQTRKIEELEAQGWADPKRHAAYGYVRMVSASGARAYIYPQWVHFIMG